MQPAAPRPAGPTQGTVQGTAAEQAAPDPSRAPTATTSRRPSASGGRKLAASACRWASTLHFPFPGTLFAVLARRAVMRACSDALWICSTRLCVS